MVTCRFRKSKYQTCDTSWLHRKRLANEHGLLRTVTRHERTHDSSRTGTEIVRNGQHPFPLYPDLFH
ncbi:hypothetical protein Bpfe_008020 [Biomphalaria pfeifferi]|uniref:Uncharacterized protein n=1 Tax=Biomphalaria pfeifferi TaxID=112525 RepID=A0AAD8BYX1_BIOPF|nr:hypothetical protein Bpfe_008020 [Biomphalaria pfeifferi]